MENLKPFLRFQQQKWIFTKLFLLQNRISQRSLKYDILFAIYSTGCPEKRGRFSIFVPQPLWTIFWELFSLNFPFVNEGSMHEINSKNLLGDIWVILVMLESRTFLPLNIFWTLDDKVMDQGVFWFQNWFETRKYITWSLLSIGAIFEKQIFDSQNFWDRIWKTSPFFWDTL